VNISNHNIEPKTDSIETVNQTGFNKIIDKIQNGFENINGKKVLIILSICLLALSILCPFAIILLALGGMDILVWLTLLGGSCFFSIIGGIILKVINYQKYKDLRLSILSWLSIIFGVISSAIWFFAVSIALSFAG
jgi:hypothetical protein